MRTNKTGRKTSKRLLLVAAMAGAIFLAGGIAMAGGNGRCYSAEITAFIALPDGSIHEPGTLRVCLTSKHSPVEGMHHTSMDGHPIAMFRSRLGESEGLGGQESSFFVFTKRDDGALELQGFATAKRDGRLTTYQMALEQVTTRWALAKEFNSDDSDMVLVAAK
jgi:hypothetical protein